MHWKVSPVQSVWGGACFAIGQAIAHSSTFLWHLTLSHWSSGALFYMHSFSRLQRFIFAYEFVQRNCLSYMMLTEFYCALSFIATVCLDFTSGYVLSLPILRDRCIFEITLRCVLLEIACMHLYGKCSHINYWNGNAEKYLHGVRKLLQMGLHRYMNHSVITHTHTHSQFNKEEYIPYKDEQIEIKMELITYCVICTRRTIPRCDNNMAEERKNVEEPLSIYRIG